MFDVRTKIRNEYIFFEQMMLGTSRQNIYSKSAEILFKRQIADYFNQSDISESDAMHLCMIDNLLEYIYLLCVEMHWSADDIDQALCEIIRRIQTGKNRKHTDEH